MSLTVVKLGGELIQPETLASIAPDIAALSADQKLLIVHGGGPQATALQKRLGQEVKVVGGRRITDADALDVMKMVVAGQLNVDLCAALTKAGGRPVGLHGASSLAVQATRRPPTRVTGGGPDPVDFGFVGDVTTFNEDLLNRLFAGGYIPVLSCLAGDHAGEVFNINADVVANKAVAHLRAERLVLITGVPGVLRTLDDPQSRIPTMTRQEAKSAMANEVVKGGMIPKLEESLNVVGLDHVACVHIVGQLRPGDLQREIANPGSVGTALLP